MPIYFLIDAFDELRDANQRQRLGRLIAALPAGPERHSNRIVVTSRVAGYEGQLRDKNVAHYRLDELDDRQSAAFVRARYRPHFWRSWWLSRAALPKYTRKW